MQAPVIQFTYCFNGGNCCAIYKQYSDRSELRKKSEIAQKGMLENGLQNESDLHDLTHEDAGDSMQNLIACTREMTENDALKDIRELKQTDAAAERRR